MIALASYNARLLTTSVTALSLFCPPKGCMHMPVSMHQSQSSEWIKREKLPPNVESHKREAAVIVQAKKQCGIVPVSLCAKDPSLFWVNMLISWTITDRVFEWCFAKRETISWTTFQILIFDTKTAHVQFEQVLVRVDGDWGKDDANERNRGVECVHFWHSSLDKYCSTIVQTEWFFVSSNGCGQRSITNGCKAQHLIGFSGYVSTNLLSLRPGSSILVGVMQPPVLLCLIWYPGCSP